MKPLPAQQPAATPGGSTGHADSPAPLIVVMGVSGSGKSTVGAALAGALGTEFVEGDALHPPDNVRRMAAGIALGDAERIGWLRTIGAKLRAARAHGVPLVVSCSALKRTYRDLLRDAAGELRFVHLQGTPELIAQRLASRRGHYMPKSLLQSQFDALEAPGVDEGAVSVDIAATPEDVVQTLLRQLAPKPSCE